jgi:hypothetical protein
MHKAKRERLGGRGMAGKAPVFTLVERGGQPQGLTITSVTGENLKSIMR